MAELLRGAPVVSAITEKICADTTALKEKGIVPVLAIFRVGEREDDLSYERSAMKRCEMAGISVKNIALPADVESSRFFETLKCLNTDPLVHGILLFRPLPKHLDEEKARNLILPEKDVDGCTDMSLAGVFTGTKMGFPPCTAQAVMEILAYYGIDPKGKRTVVIGRSLVIGRPAAMMLMQANATVTICHTRTTDVPSITREADIIVAACGQMESIGKEYLREGQTVIDVGIHWNEEKHKLCGDVKWEEAEHAAASITPVPGGVGGVTTAVLARHVADAAMKAAALGSGKELHY